MSTDEPQVAPPNAQIYGTLRLRFGSNGRILTQVFRQDCIAVYERSRPDKPAHELELVVIGLRKEWLAPNGRLVDASEVYPGSEDWGSRGWSFPIRLREWVFELARRMATMGPPYGKWVRKELGIFKDRGKRATVQEVASQAV